MARTTWLETLESKSEKAPMDVVKTKQRYDTAVAKLGDLMDKRDVLKKDELVTEIMKRGKSYEAILRFLNDDERQDE